MIPVSNDYKRELIAGNRNYLIKADTFLKGNTSSTPDFTLTNEHIWDNGITIDQAISSDDTFDIGAAIVGSLKIVIDNIKGDFSSYDFYDAKITLWLGVTGDIDSGDNQRYYRIGFYVVDEPVYNGSLITLNCLDNMTWFDVPFSQVTGISYPATAGTVVQRMCQTVGVTLGTPSFPNYSNSNTRLLEAPKENLNCREVLQYIAQMCCCYCKINTAGQLVLKWHDKNAIIGITNYDGGTYNTTTTPYSDGDAVEGGHFNPWDGDTADGGLFTDLMNNVFISQNYEISVSTDDIVVTGCRVRNNTSKDDSYDELWVDSTLELTHERYVLIIDNNPFVSASTAANIANIVGSTLAGLPIRAFNATSLSDFSYETGDMATVIDFRGNRYYTWLTHFTFTTNNSEQFSCGVESLRKRSEERFSGTVKTLAEANENASAMLSSYDLAVKALNDLGTNAIGYNEHIYPLNAGIGTSRTVWRYDGSSRTGTDANPKFPNSNSVFKITGNGVFVALRSNGDIAADGTCTFSNGYDANSGTAILNTLYSKGITCDSIRAGRLSLGGSDGGQYKNGELYMYDSSNNEAGHWNRSGISVKTGTITLNGKTSLTDAVDGVFVSKDGLALGKNSAFKVTNAGRVDCTDLNVTGGSIEGTSIKSKSAHNGETTINGGSITIDTANDAYFTVQYVTGSYTRRITFGEEISVRDESHGIQANFSYRDFYNALHDTEQDEHSSDRRLKKKIKKIPVSDSRNLILGIEPKYYEFKKTEKGEEGKRSGFIAQEVREVLDELGNDSVIERESPRKEGTRQLLYQDFIAHLVNTTQELYKEVGELKQELAELKAKVE